jgi:2-polyprenyl-6-methoxyphenol hydroxylase-like FAD-dependent oxidoreductase
MPKEAHIIGGGIGGLAAAGALAQNGWKVVVHERSPELREVGAGIFLKENGIRVLERLGCMPEILAHGTRLAKSELQDANGQTLLLRDIANERVYTVLRATLQQMLADAAKKLGVDVETASEVSDVSSDGRLSKGGREYKVDLIVGADGLGSAGLGWKSLQPFFQTDRPGFSYRTEQVISPIGASSNGEATSGLWWYP